MWKKGEFSNEHPNDPDYIVYMLIPCRKHVEMNERGDEKEKRKTI